MEAEVQKILKWESFLINYGNQVTLLLVPFRKKIWNGRKNAVHSRATPQINVCKQLRNNIECEYYLSKFFPHEVYIFPDFFVNGKLYVKDFFFFCINVKMEIVHGGVKSK